MPTALGCNKHTILAAGVDLSVAVYSKTGRLIQTLDLSTDGSLREFTCMAVGPSGDVAVVGAFDAFVGLSYSEADQRWSQTYVKKVRGLCECRAVSRGARRGAR